MKARKTNRLSIAAGLIGAILFATTTFVHAIAISDLFAGATITAYDKEFYDWTSLADLRIWRDGGGDTTVTTGVDYTEIDVQAVLDDPLNPGLRFVASDSSGLSVSAPDVAGSPTEILDVVFMYNVRTLDGSARIKDNSLELLDFGGSSLFSLSITETLGGSQGGIGGKLVHAEDIDDGLQAVLLDTLTFPPESFLNVTTTIHMAAASQGPQDGNARINSFEQRFSQIPEPASLALMGLGLAGIGFQRRKKAIH